MRTQKDRHFEIVEFHYLPPVTTPANNHVYTDVVLSKYYNPAEYAFILTTVSINDQAWTCCTGKWMNQSSSNVIRVYRTNLYQGGSQDIGFYLFIIKR